MGRFAKADKQAAKAIKGKIALSTPRHGNRADGKIHSVRTAHHYEGHLTQVAQWLADTRAGHGLPKLTADEATRYLVDRSITYSQSALDQARQAIECLLGQKLERVRSEREIIQTTRSYTPDQVDAVRGGQSDRNALSTEIADEAGLRAHELLTIARMEEQAPSFHRFWLPDIFKGREEWIRYSVVGKGGLTREVRLSPPLAYSLETHRLPEPVLVTDRGVVYEKRYEIAGGAAWSKSFSVAANKALGFSNGGHGLRHGYAQLRMDDYQSMGFTYYDALAHVANELGHFAPSTTEVYLR